MGNTIRNVGDLDARCDTIRASYAAPTLLTADAGAVYEESAPIILDALNQYKTNRDTGTRCNIDKAVTDTQRKMMSRLSDDRFRLDRLRIQTDLSHVIRIVNMVATRQPS